MNNNNTAPAKEVPVLDPEKAARFIRLYLAKQGVYVSKRRILQILDAEYEYMKLIGIAF